MLLAHLSAQKITMEVCLLENHKETTVRPPEYTGHPIRQTFWSSYWIQSRAPATAPRGPPSLSEAPRCGPTAPTRQTETRAMRRERRNKQFSQAQRNMGKLLLSQVLYCLVTRLFTLVHLKGGEFGC